ncbi:DUF3592 domain-containing protein [Aeromicrobium fastidiosum]|uniref:DUF3592 domain-containing protein n=1 Tax=Aeromicrobium fastidiosum TaxID=52699 RepID=A0A641AI96_9ACTN|nr:DUF3592 domain-containing protein [Aeromicrobium fastidiosum]KAA1374589.1 hypothetical protein ESP62_014415 [Aeromicrobium fastidiosum]MBP2390872.1 hypothetical protein [Aeromicrobium fastidiosum]
MPVPSSDDVDMAAWHDPAVRAAWRAHVRRASRLVVGAVVVMLVVGAIWTVLLRQDDAALRDGVETSATVTGGYVGNGMRQFPDTLYVSYEVDGKRFGGTLEGESPKHHPEGSRITVVYDPDSPSEFRTPSNANHPFWVDFPLFMVAMGALVALAVGVWGGVAARRWRGWLLAHGTTDVHLRSSSNLPGDDGNGRFLLRISRGGPAPLDVVTRLSGPRRWTEGSWVRSRSLKRFDGPGRMCRGTRRRLIVFAPDAKLPLEVALPRRSTAAQGWMERFAPRTPR